MLFSLRAVLVCLLTFSKLNRPDKKAIPLGALVEDAYVVCYRENIQGLSDALTDEGFAVHVFRQKLNKSFDHYSSAQRCLLNHLEIWKQIKKGQSSALIVEADFVPSHGMSTFDCPYPGYLDGSAVGYLYGCGIEIYDMIDSKFARGHSASTVAYIIPPTAARYLCEFANSIFSKPDGSRYSAWDTQIRYYLQERGVPSFVPFRNFGEHGGIANSEHAKHILVSSHRADVLANDLYFLPEYASGSKALYHWVRFKARLWGLARVVAGRLLRFHDVKRQSSPRSIIEFVLRRQIPFLALRKRDD